MSRPFFYRITAADFLAAVAVIPEAERGAWAFQLAIDMVTADQDTAKLEFSKTIIKESLEFSEKKRSAGKAGGRKKADNQDSTKYGNTRAERMAHARSIATHTSAEWEAMKAVFDYTCVICGDEIEGNVPTKDHVVPVSCGGSDGIDNIQPSCRSCNVSKGTKSHDYRFTDWKQSLSKHLAITYPVTEAVTVHKPKPLVLKDETSTRVIEYLNAKTGKSYKTDTAATIKLIKARLKEGFIPEDFKTAIDNQCREWLNDPEYEKYLRPATLFAPSKFDGYLQNTKATATGEYY